MTRKAGGEGGGEFRTDADRSGSGSERQRVRRSDETLTRELHEILTQDPELDATEIEIEVERGTVTISGVVDSSDAKLLAEELVESVAGVRLVHNRLRVER
jgi:osmotically-inducible protein OsmY